SPPFKKNFPYAIKHLHGVRHSTPASAGYYHPGSESLWPRTSPKNEKGEPAVTVTPRSTVTKSHPERISGYTINNIQMFTTRYDKAALGPAPRCIRPLFPPPARLGPTSARHECAPLRAALTIKVHDRQRNPPEVPRLLHRARPPDRAQLVARSRQRSDAAVR